MSSTSSRCLLLTIVLLIGASCQTDPTRVAIQQQLQLYPETRVQDIYKSFCQDNLGPGHLIPNLESARAYLTEELKAYQEDLDNGRYEIPGERYVPVGDCGNYVRVDLSVVLDSLVDAETILQAFARSANEEKTLSPEDWEKKWASVAAVIRKDFSFIPDAAEDLATIDAYLADGQYILHHSRIFNETYHPHYRIVARDIFDNELKPRLSVEN